MDGYAVIRREGLYDLKNTGTFFPLQPMPSIQLRGVAAAGPCLNC